MLGVRLEVLISSSGSYDRDHRLHGRSFPTLVRQHMVTGVEIVLRCILTDQPGALALLAGAVAECGGDIRSVEVLGHEGEDVFDDLTVVIDPSSLRTLIDRLRRMDCVELVHAGPSRGHPGDAVTRVAIGIEALLVGAMTPQQAVVTLVGGILRASSAELCDTRDAPKPGRRTLVIPVDGRVLVVRRGYPFTGTERERAATLVRACVAAAQPRQPSPSRSG